MLEINNISKKLGDTQVLSDCNLNVEAGTILGLVGINGAGKSTMLRCIAGIYECDNGEVRFDGEDIYENSERKKEIFLIDDNPYYERNATIKDLKAFYSTFYDFDEANYQKYLAMFKLDENKAINNFSKGMKRQVFILMALAIKPRLLMLDEAFDGLDPLVRLNLKRALIEQIEENNITVIISSHNLRELEDICDHFALLENHEIDSKGNIGDSKDNIHKIQLAFRANIDPEQFKELDIITSSKEGRVISIVVEGEIENIRRYLNRFEPLIMDVLDVSFEELFIYELIKKGYSTYE